MFKVNIKDNQTHIVKRLGEMQPCEIGKIVTPSTTCIGHIVMRTASIGKFEVMDLTDPGPGSCWITEVNTIFVEILSKGTVLELFIQ